MSLPHSAEVVIVGAGVMGASVAHHLAARGCRDVLLLDRAPAAGAGSTGRATGGFRVQYDMPVNVGLSLLSLEKLRRFRDEIGVDPEYQPHGYLFIARREGDLAQLRKAQAVQHAAGATRTREVSAAEVRELNPAVVPDGIVGGVFSDVDGFMRPMALATGWLASAERAGVRVAWGQDVTGFEREGHRVTGVVTSEGRVAAGAVVNAGGPWAAKVAALAGVDLPVRPIRRQVGATVVTDALPASMPMTAYVEDGFHTRVRDGRILWLWPHDVGVEESFDTAFHLPWLEKIQALARERMPGPAKVPIDLQACHCGLYEMSPDKTAILGRAPGLGNFYLINGSSGHGVMHSPALGQLLAEVILDGRATSLDIRPLRPERFAEGEPNVGTGLL
jgi:sarcosine oxidase subunit beta